MRINQLKRIFMSEVDSGSGNGAAVPATTETPAAAPQAKGDAPLTLDSILGALDKRLEEREQKLHDKLFAAVRRDGGLSKSKPQPKADEPPAEPTAGAHLSASEERAYLRGLDRFLVAKGIAPNAAQYERAEKALLSERPGSVESWAADYFDGFGGAKPQPVQTQTAAPAKPVSEHPVSNRGAPPPAQTPIEEIDLWTATDSDRAAFAKSKGIKAYVDTLRKQGKGRPVKF